MGRLFCKKTYNEIIVFVLFFLKKINNLEERITSGSLQDGKLQRRSLKPYCTAVCWQ